MEKFILLTCYILSWIIIFWLMLDNIKRTSTLLDQLETSLTEQLKLINEKSKLMEIIIMAKTNKENYFITLEKIEKELFK